MHAAASLLGAIAHLRPPGVGEPDAHGTREPLLARLAREPPPAVLALHEGLRRLDAAGKVGEPHGAAARAARLEGEDKDCDPRSCPPRGPQGLRSRADTLCYEARPASARTPPTIARAPRKRRRGGQGVQMRHTSSSLPPSRLPSAMARAELLANPGLSPRPRFVQSWNKSLRTPPVTDSSLFFFSRKGRWRMQRTMRCQRKHSVSSLVRV